MTNPLDKDQVRAILKEEQARRRVAPIVKAKAHAEYRFTPLSADVRLKEIAGHSLAIWIFGDSRKPEEIAGPDALHDRYFTPKALTRSQFLTPLHDQARGASVISMKGIPIVLFRNESKSETEVSFKNWVHRARRLAIFGISQKSADVTDVCFERKLRIEFAKLKAKGQLRSAFMPQMREGQADISVIRPTV